MAQTKAQLIDGKGDVDLGALSISGSAPDNSVNLDASGRLLVGTSSARSNVNLQAGDRTPFVQIETATDSYNNGISIINNSVSGFAPQISLGLSLSTSIGSNANVAPSSAAAIGMINFVGNDGDQFLTGARIEAVTDAVTGNNDMPCRLVFYTTADGASSPTERLRIDSTGTCTFNAQKASEGSSSNDAAFLFRGATGTGAFQIMRMNTGLYNAAACGVSVGTNSTTGRSINAGGTVNASGADYAEYMIKAGDFTISKGDISGVTADGLLTLDYADAVSFVVKSTNPSYVGGDTWGSENVIGAEPDAKDADALTQWRADLEAARQKVDRIAFAGQVPVNVMGATPGQYIVPVEAADGGIEGIAKSEADLTLAEYMRAVGKVIAIEDDGRARIIVKVA